MHGHGAGGYARLRDRGPGSGGKSERRLKLAEGDSLEDAVAPTVEITLPAPKVTVSAAVNVVATASDDVGLARISFYVDGVLIGTEDTTAPYTVSWNSTGVTNGVHTLTGVARDQYGNRRTGAPVNVDVQNSPVRAGLVAARGSDEGAGAIAGDRTGNGNDGTISNAVWVAGKVGNALSFNGTRASSLQV